jgi:hypothetical protein
MRGNRTRSRQRAEPLRGHACKRAVCGPEEDFSPAFRKNDEPTAGIDRQCIGDTEPSEGINMPMQRGNYKFDAEDEKVYTAWLRRTLVAYGVLILIGISVLTIHAARGPNLAEFVVDTATLTRR